MIYSILFGVSGVVSFIHTNHKLQQKYYNDLADKKEEWKVSQLKTSSLGNKSTWFPLSPYNTKNYSSLQKNHYFWTLVMFVLFSAASMEAYLRGYTKLHLIHKNLIYLPLDIAIFEFLNSTFFYLYHRAAHTKYIYHYIHQYHHTIYHPEPFDSLVGHPLDHTCSAICQVIPMFIYSSHVLSFIIYSTFLSYTGIWDHSGIKINLFHHSSMDHHVHHLYPSKNYGAGFPILVWDKLFGTYRGTL